MANHSPKKKWSSEQAIVGMACGCNIDCLYCHSPSTGIRFDPGKKAAELKKAGVKAVSLEGPGEPTTNRDFFVWIKELKAAGVKNFMLSTNAVELSDVSFCRKADRAIDSFTVNFPSHRPEVYAKITRSGKFPLAIKGLANIKAIGAEGKLRFFHIISSLNYKLLPEFALWAAKNFPRAAFTSFVFVRSTGRALENPWIVPRYTQVAPFLKTALIQMKLKGYKAVAQSVPLCVLKDFEGFSFEFLRWHRGDKVLEGSMEPKAACPACSRCTLEPACCGARPDYLKVHGAGELKASKKDPFSIKPEQF